MEREREREREREKKKERLSFLQLISAVNLAILQTLS
jgi:hypothetical protein